MDLMRFSRGLDEGDYINFYVDEDYTKMSEINTNFQALMQRNSFNVE